MFETEGLSEIQIIEKRWTDVRNLAFVKRQEPIELTPRIEELKIIKKELVELKVDPCLNLAKMKLGKAMDIEIEFFQGWISRKWGTKLYITEVNENFDSYKQSMDKCKK